MFLKKRKKKNNSRTRHLKQFFGGISLVVILISCSYGIYQSYAALSDSDQKQNQLRIGDVRTEIEETFEAPQMVELDTAYTKKITVRNIGEQPIFLRVLPVAKLYQKQTDGTILLLPSTNETLSIDYNDTDWINGEDGYYYYKSAVKPSEGTTTLFTTVKINKTTSLKTNEGLHLTFEIKAEGISITKYAYRDAWWQTVTPDKEPLAKIDQILVTQTLDDE